MIAWAAFVLAVLELVLLAGVVLLAARFWRQVAPQVTPLLAMFTPPAASTSSRPDDPSPRSGSSS